MQVKDAKINQKIRAKVLHYILNRNEYWILKINIEPELEQN